MPVTDLPPIASISAKENAINNTAVQVDIADAEQLVSTDVTVLALPPKYAQLNAQIALELRVPPANADGSFTLQTPAGPLLVLLPNLPVGQNALGLVLTPGSPTLATVLLPTNTHAAAVAANAANNAVNTLIDAVLPDAVILPAALPANTANWVLPGQILNAYPLAAATELVAPELVDHEIILSAPLQTPAVTGQPPAASAATVLASLPQSLPQAVSQLSVPGRLLATIQTTLQSLQQQGDTPLLQQPQNRAGLQQVFTPFNNPGPPDTHTVMAQPNMANTGDPPATARWQIIQLAPAGQELPVLPIEHEDIWVGKVQGQTPQGLPVIQLTQNNQNSLWVLPAAKGLTTGTQIWVQAAPEIETAAATAKPAIVADFKPGVDKQWPALEATLLQLVNQEWQLNTTLANTLPKLNAQLPITALFFLTALRTGDIRNWLGEGSLDKLRTTGRGADTLAKLDSEFKKLRDGQDETQPGEWQSYPLPFADLNGLSVMQLFVRRYNGEPLPEDEAEHNHGKSKQPDARFVVEIAFSELGAVQIDGLIRRKEGHRLLDMVVRTQNMLSADLRNELREAFINVLGVTAVTGTLAFQTGSHNWLQLRK